MGQWGQSPLSQFFAPQRRQGSAAFFTRKTAPGGRKRLLCTARGVSTGAAYPSAGHCVTKKRPRPRPSGCLADPPGLLHPHRRIACRTREAFSATNPPNPCIAASPLPFRSALLPAAAAPQRPGFGVAALAGTLRLRSLVLAPLRVTLEGGRSRSLRSGDGGGRSRVAPPP